MGNKKVTWFIIIFLFSISTTLYAEINTEGSRLITWDPVTLDINGNPESIIYYYIYCNESPILEPTINNFLAATTKTNYRHYDERYINPDFRLYYIVSAVDEFGNESLGTYDFSLPVELYSFEVIEENGKIVLNWITQSEKNNLGFNLYKSTEKNGPLEKINQDFIKGKGPSTNKTEYTYIDQNVQPLQVYYYMLESIDINGKKTRYEPKKIFVTGGNADRFLLTQNYPNPFNPQTTIKYAIPEDSHVQIVIYNSQGGKIMELVNTYQSSGLYTITWHGHNTFGKKVSSGIYYYKMKTEKFSDVKKMLFTK